jgi:hypothetical protein
MSPIAECLYDHDELKAPSKDPLRSTEFICYTPNRGFGDTRSRHGSGGDFYVFDTVGVFNSFGTLNTHWILKGREIPKALRVQL